MAELEYRLDWRAVEAETPIMLVLRDGDVLDRGVLRARDYVVVPRECYEGFFIAASREAGREAGRVWDRVRGVERRRVLERRVVMLLPTFVGVFCYVAGRLS